MRTSISAPAQPSVSAQAPESRRSRLPAVQHDEEDAAEHDDRHLGVAVEEARAEQGQHDAAHERQSRGPSRDHRPDQGWKIGQG